MIAYEPDPDTSKFFGSAFTFDVLKTRFLLADTILRILGKQSGIRACSDISRQLQCPKMLSGLEPQRDREPFFWSSSHCQRPKIKNVLCVPPVFSNCLRGIKSNKQLNETDITSSCLLSKYLLLISN